MKLLPTIILSLEAVGTYYIIIECYGQTFLAYLCNYCSFKILIPIHNCKSSVLCRLQVFVVCTYYNNRGNIDNGVKIGLS